MTIAQLPPPVLPGAPPQGPQSPQPQQPQPQPQQQVRPRETTRNSCPISPTPPPSTVRQPRQDIVSPPSPAVRRSRPLYDYDDELDRPSIWRELSEEDELLDDMSVGSHNPMQTTLDTMETSSPATTVTMDSDLPMALDDSISTESLLSHRLREHERFYQ